MAVKIALVPDGISKLPAEATDDEVLRAYLENSGYENWRDVERMVYGGPEKLELRLSGDMSDYDQSDLDTISKSITSNISGVKEYPTGWQNVDAP